MSAELPRQTEPSPPRASLTAPPPRWPGLRAPAIALLLGILPFWLFFGFHQKATVNGRVVQDSGLNILGLALAIAGIIMVFKMLRDDGSYGHPPRWLPRTVLAVLAGLVCLFQAGQSLGLYRFDPSERVRDLRVRFFGNPEPGAVTYAGLDAARRDGLVKRGREIDEGRLRDDVVTVAARLRAGIVQYNLFSTTCADGYRRFPTVELPSFLIEDDRRYIAQAEESTALRWRNMRCDARIREAMSGPVIDSIHRDRAVLDLAAGAYRERFGARPPATPPTVRAETITTQGLPVQIGQTVAEAQAALGLSNAPQVDPEWREPALAAADRGITVFFGPDGKVMRIVLDPPFSGTVVDVALGDSLRSINRKVGGATSGERGINETFVLNSYGNGRLVFRSSFETGTINRIVLR
ncbi:hypothetical protein BN1110_03067 [bacterium YEK0313]|nr:hypothetical protein BN1110_03067 [bacterium YEK0313]